MKKVIPLICILLTVTVCVFGIVFLSTHTDSPEEETPNSESYRTPLHASVESGIITSTLSSKGQVIGGAPEVYIEHMVVEFGSKSNAKRFSTPHQVGAVLEQGDLLYTFKEKEVKVDYACKLVELSITDTSATFSLLVYDRLYIVTSVDYDKLSSLDFDTKTVLTVDLGQGEQEYPGQIINFGYEVTDEKVAVYIRCDQRLLPGTPVEVSFEMVHTTQSLYILKQMLLMDGDTYYVQVVDADGTRTRRDVEIGAFFSEYQDNVEFEFVEIKSGLAEGEQLVIDLPE